MATQRKQVITENGTKNREWEVDVNVLRLVRGNDWIRDYPTLITTDLTQMAETFPHWILTVGNQSGILACPNDRDYYVPKDSTLRCVNCNTPLSDTADKLIWTGMLPVQISGADRVERNIRSLIDSGRMPLPYVDKGTLFLLVPIIVWYPSQWPNSQPTAFYTREFWRCLGQSPSGASHERHMNGDLQMCLFASWNRMTIRDVIQNRIIPHALAQVKISNGQRPDSRWFNT